MPIYGYVCEKCGSQMEVMQRFSDAPLKRCRKCRGKLGKVVSRTSFKLKGSGWYATDYSSKPAPARSKAEGSSDGKTKTEGSSDGKTKTEGSSDGKTESASRPATKDSAGAGSGD